MAAQATLLAELRGAGVPGALLEECVRALEEVGVRTVAGLRWLAAEGASEGAALVRRAAYARG